MKLLFKMNDRQKRIFSLIREHKARFYFAIVCMLLVAASTPALAYLIKPILDDIFVNKDTWMLMMLPAVIVIVYVLRGIGMYGQEYFMGYVGEGIIRKIRNTLYDRITDLPVSFFHSEKTGVLMSRVTYDVSIIKQMVSTTVTGFSRDCFTIIFLIAYIFYLDWKMSLFAVVILPAAFYPIIIFGRRVRKASTGCQEAIADISSFLHETFSGNKIVKAFGMEEHEKKSFSDMSKKMFQLEVKAIIARSLSSPIMEFLGGLGIAVIILYGGSRVINGELTVGEFMSFIAAVVMLYDPVKKLSKLNNSIQEGFAATDRIYDIIERETAIKEQADPVVIKPGHHKVSFENVFFKYEDDMVLKDINLEVKAGEVLALVGTSGGGKTSLVNLIPRFYDVAKGSIMIDDVDIRNASIESLRKQIAIVTQEPILFNDTVQNNIAYGNPKASIEEIEAAAKAAYAYDFIQSFPKQFDTTIGELGSRLSGGEKQRICIARALIKDAPILILDEATSALDTESEMLVQKALENLMKGRTTFVIAHRLSTISYANRIIVVANGSIVEEGEHDELIVRNGEYHKLYQMQFANSKM